LLQKLVFGGWCFGTIHSGAKKEVVMAKKEMKLKRWVVRDADGVLTLYRNKPVKYPDIGYWDDRASLWYAFIPDGFLPLDINPQWEDEEPIEIEMTIRRVKED
jgi:hypothetical protein